jgi:hypothetical protein
VQQARSLFLLVITSEGGGGEGYPKMKGPPFFAMTRSSFSSCVSNLQPHITGFDHYAVQKIMQCRGKGGRDGEGGIFPVWVIFPDT